MVGSKSNRNRLPLSALRTEFSEGKATKPSGLSVSTQPGDILLGGGLKKGQKSQNDQQKGPSWKDVWMVFNLEVIGHVEPVNGTLEPCEGAFLFTGFFGHERLPHGVFV